MTAFCLDTRLRARLLGALMLLPACGGPASDDSGMMGGPEAPEAPGGSSSGEEQAPAPAGEQSPGQTESDFGDADSQAPVDQSPPPPTLLGDVAFSQPSQTFRGELAVTLSTELPGTEVRYTTDGTRPSSESTLYAGTPVTLTQTAQLRAQAFLEGAAQGRMSSALYVARDFDFDSDLPIVIVDGYGGGKPSDKNVYLDAAVMIFAPEEGRASLDRLPTIATRAGYHVRGQSSSRFPKTPYRLELWDNDDEDVDYAVLGMHAQSDWALISPYYDRTLIRNPFAYELGRDMGLAAPHVEYVELYLAYEGSVLTEDDYQGIYWLTETIKNAKGRVDLKQLRPEDTALPQISGGYIFKFDQAAAEEPTLACSGAAPLPGFGGFGGGGFGGGGFGGGGFGGGGFGGGGFGGGGFGGSTGAPESGTCWRDLEVVDPAQLNAEQTAWLTQYVQDFHDSLHRSPIGNYAEYIDVASFVDYLIVNELSRNVDAYVRSAYYHKDRDGKLHAGPLWDYNFGLGLGGGTSIDPDGPFQYDGSRNVSNWFPQLTKDPQFMQQVRARWRELRTDLMSDQALIARVDALAAPLTEAIGREYARWPVAQIYANPGIVRGSTAPEWSAQLQDMRDYLVARAAKMDASL